MFSNEIEFQAAAAETHNVPSVQSTSCSSCIVQTAECEGSRSVTVQSTELWAWTAKTLT